MSVCTRCGATFGCAMADGGDEPCWCTRLPPVVPVPVPVSASAPAPVASPARADAAARGLPGCWCPACLQQHIAHLDTAAPGTDRDA